MPNGRGTIRAKQCKSRSRLRFGVAIALSAAALAAPATAEGATTTIGSLAGPGDVGPGTQCGFCRFFQSSTGASSPSYVVPAGNWVVTSWSTRIGANPVTAMRLFMVEHAGGIMYTLRAQDTQNATQTDSVNTFFVRVPVSPGWILGLDTGDVGPSSYLSSDPADVIRIHSDTTIGNTTSDNTFFAGALVNISATLESDCDSDGFGDDTQDPDTSACDPPAPTDGSAPDTTITKQPKPKTRKKAVLFEFTASEPGSQFECKLDDGAFQPCGSPHTVKAGKGRHTLSVRARDAAGNVDGSPATASWKVKKKRKRK